MKMSGESNEGIIAFKWNNHKTTFFNVLSSMRAKEFCTDATLGCEGKLYPVHKIVLCSSSDYFCDIFRETNCKSPVVILKDVRHNNLEALLDYMYLGEVEVQQRDLPDLIQAADCLRIKGLAVPDDGNLTPSKELSPINKEIISKGCIKSVTSDHVNSSLPVTVNTNISTIVIPSTISTTDSEILSSPKKCVKHENDKYFNKSKNFTLFSTENFCKASNDVEVPLKSHSNSPNTSWNYLTDSSGLLQKKISKNQASPHNTPAKKLKLSRKKIIKRSLSVKETVSKNHNRVQTEESVCSAIFPESEISDLKVVAVKSEQISLDDINEKSEKFENSFLKNNKNDDVDGLNNPDGKPFLSQQEQQEPGSSTSLPKKIKREEYSRICEEFCDEIGLPIFSESLAPYIEGHELEEKEKKNLANKLIEELVEHLKLHKMLERMYSPLLRSSFYSTLQQRIIGKYPNIIREESTWKRGKKGPLSCLINKLSSRICCSARKDKVPFNNDSVLSSNETEGNMEKEDEYQENDEMDDDDDVEFDNSHSEYNSQNEEMLKNCMKNV